jgi:hypothetical protein
VTVSSDPMKVLRIAADKFHEVVSSLAAEDLLADNRNATVVEKLRENLRSRDQIKRIAADGFKLCVRALAAAGEPGVTIHEAAVVEQEARTLGDDPLVDILHRTLGSRTGKLRVSDAYRLAGIEPGKASQDQIFRFGRAICELGWERKRRRFDGALEYAYVKGNPAEREVELLSEYDPHMLSECGDQALGEPPWSGGDDD